MNKAPTPHCPPSCMQKHPDYTTWSKEQLIEKLCKMHTAVHLIKKFGA